MRRRRGQFFHFTTAAITSAFLLAFAGCPAESGGSGGEGYTASGVAVSPASATVAKGGIYDFIATVTGASADLAKAVKWSIIESGRSVGTGVTGDGTLIVSPDETLSSLRVKAAAVVDSSIYGLSDVLLSDAAAVITGVIPNPRSAQVSKGSTFQFTATVTGEHSPAQQVTWSIVETNKKAATTIDGTGLLIVALDETLSTVTVKATSAVDTSKYGTAQVSVKAAQVTVNSVSITPSSLTAMKGSISAFSAAVTGLNNPAQSVIWSILEPEKNENTVITVDGKLIVSASETLRTLTVQAVSTLDENVSAQAEVTVINAVEVGSVTVSPVSAAIERGEYAMFSAFVDGVSSQDVTWSVVEEDKNAGTGFTADGKLVVSTNESRETLTVRATSTVDSTKYGTAQVTLSGGAASSVTQILVTPTTVSVKKGAHYTFSTLVSGNKGPDTSVTWSVVETGRDLGTGINGEGVLMVSLEESLSTLTVKAVSVATPSISGTAAVTVLPADTSGTPVVTDIAVSPASVTVGRGQHYDFTATVTGTGNPSPAVVWTIDERELVENSGINDGTAISSSGRLVISSYETLKTLKIRATSIADSSKSAAAEVKIAAVSGVTISPNTGVSVKKGGTVDFQAVVYGDSPAQSVVWDIVNTEVSGGTYITSTGRLVVDADEVLTSFTVRATSREDSTKFGIAVVSVTEDAVAVTISPAGPISRARGSISFFTAEVTGQGDSQDVLWSILPPVSGGTKKEATVISSDGVLLIAVDETLSTLTIRAVSFKNPDKYADAVVTVTEE